MIHEINSRIESETEVRAYVQNLKFALNNGAKIDFQVNGLLMRNEMKSIQISTQ